jgi:hypothetical protein
MVMRAFARQGPPAVLFNDPIMKRLFDFFVLANGSCEEVSYGSRGAPHSRTYGDLSGGFHSGATSQKSLVRGSGDDPHFPVWPVRRRVEHSRPPYPWDTFKPWSLLLFRKTCSPNVTTTAVTPRGFATRVKAKARVLGPMRPLPSCNL